MGRFLIFAVLATVIGSATLTLSMQRSRQASDARHVETQADLLAREIAEAGHQAAAGAMVTDAGLVDPRDRLGGEQRYAGGQFAISYAPLEPGNSAKVTVTGFYGGATHTSERVYERTEFDAPGPLWLDVPHAVATVATGAVVFGGPVAFDPRQHTAGGLDPVAPLADLRSDLADVAARVGAPLYSPSVAEWASASGPLDGVNAADAAALYRTAVAAKAAGDQTFAGSQTVVGTATWGLASDGAKITHVEGDLTVNGELTGHGALIVDGALRVRGELNWDGLVLVHGTGPVLPVHLNGRVTVDGMVVVSHEVFPTTGTALAAVTDAALALLTAGRPFGTDLVLGNRTEIRYDRAQLKELAAKLGFDPDGVRLVSSTSTHLTAAEARAVGAVPSGPSAPTEPAPTEPAPTEPAPTEPAPTEPGTVPPDGSPIPSSLPGTTGKLWICHFTPSTGEFRSNYLHVDALLSHSTHPGDYMGQCTVSGETGGNAGAGGGGGRGRGGG